MLFQPSGVIPSTFAGNGAGVIDATVDNDFVSYISGSSFVDAYKLIIYQNTIDNDIVYNTGVVELTTPFSHTNSLGKKIPFIISVPSTSGMVNGYANGYKWTLTIWWNYNSSSPTDDCITSYEYPFSAKSTPTLEINSITSPIEQRNYTFTATYTQSEGVGLMWFQWMLALASDHTKIIKQTKQIYGSPSVELSFDGLTPNNYSVRVIGENHDGISLDSDWVDFSVDYSTTSLERSITLSKNSDSSVTVDWSKIKYIVGVPLNANYSFETDTPVSGHTSIKIESDNNVFFEGTDDFPMDFPNNSTYIIRTRVYGDQDIWKFDTVDGLGSPYYIKLYHEGIIPGLRPNTGLYPGTGLYPQSTNWGRFVLTINGTTNFYFNTPDFYKYLYTIICTRTSITVHSHLITA